MKPPTALLPLLFTFAAALVASSRTNDVALFRHRSQSAVDYSPADFSPLDSVGYPVADGFKLTGPVSLIKPCCVSWGPGRVDCFIRDEDNSILHWSKQDGVVNGWERLDGVYTKNVECVSRQKGSIDIFAVRHDAHVYVNSVNGFTNVWTGWKSVSGARLMETPSCAVRSTAEIHCSGRDIYNKVNTAVYKSGKWSSWVYRGLYTRLVCKTSYRTATVTDFSCVTDTSLLYFASISGSSWISWSNRAGRLIGQPEVKSMGDNNFHVLGVSEKNQLAHLEYNGAWKSWVNLEGSIIDAPSCVVVAASLHCFMVGTDSFLYGRSLEDGKWSGWVSYGGSFIEGPSCISSDPGKKEISCYLRGPSKKIVERVFTF